MRDLNEMKTIGDDALMAWVDGELDAAAAAQVQAHVDAHPEAAVRAAALRDLNHQLRASFAPELAEPVPPALAAAARGEHLQAPRPAPSGRVIPWPARPGARQTASTWVRWGGLAAGVLLAVWGGPQLWILGRAEPDLLTQADGRVMARGALARSLENGLASDGTGGPVRVLLSFKDRSGQFCRTFSAPAGTGLACRDAGRWQVAVLAARPQSEDRGLRLAGGDLPATVLDAVERRISGLALDASQERAARDTGWQP